MSYRCARCGDEDILANQISTRYGYLCASCLDAKFGELEDTATRLRCAFDDGVKGHDWLQANLPARYLGLNIVNAAADWIRSLLNSAERLMVGDICIEQAARTAGWSEEVNTAPWSWLEAEVERLRQIVRAEGADPDVYFPGGLSKPELRAEVTRLQSERDALAARWESLVTAREDVTVEALTTEQVRAALAGEERPMADEKRFHVREACRHRMPLDGTDAKMLEYAITITERERDDLRARLRKTAQILIDAVGADGPMDAEDAARRVVAALTVETLRKKAVRTEAELANDRQRICEKVLRYVLFVLRGSERIFSTDLCDEVQMAADETKVEIERLKGESAEAFAAWYFDLEGSDAGKAEKWIQRFRAALPGKG